MAGVLTLSSSNPLQSENEHLRRQLHSLQGRLSNAVAHDSLIDSLQQRVIQAREERDKEVRESDALFSQLQEHLSAKQEADDLRAALLDIVTQARTAAASHSGNSASAQLAGDHQDTDQAPTDQALGAAPAPPQLLSELRRVVADLAQRSGAHLHAVKVTPPDVGNKVDQLRANAVSELVQDSATLQPAELRAGQSPHSSHIPAPAAAESSVQPALVEEARNKTQRRLDWGGTSPGARQELQLQGVPPVSPCQQSSKQVLSSLTSAAEPSANWTDEAVVPSGSGRVESCTDKGAPQQLGDSCGNEQSGVQLWRGGLGEQQQQHARGLEGRVEQLTLQHSEVEEHGHSPSAVEPMGEMLQAVTDSQHGEDGQQRSEQQLPHSAEASVVKVLLQTNKALGGQEQDASIDDVISPSDQGQATAYWPGQPLTHYGTDAAVWLQHKAGGPVLKADLPTQLALGPGQVYAEAHSLLSGPSRSPGQVEGSGLPGPAMEEHAVGEHLHATAGTGEGHDGAQDTQQRHMLHVELEVERLKRHNTQLRLDAFVSRAQLKVACLVPGSSHGTPATPPSARASHSRLSPRAVTLGSGGAGRRRTLDSPLRPQVLTMGQLTPRGSARSPHGRGRTKDASTPEARSISRMEDERTKVRTTLDRAHQQRSRLKAQALQMHELITQLRQENAELRQRLGVTEALGAEAARAQTAGAGPEAAGARAEAAWADAEAATAVNSPAASCERTAVSAQHGLSTAAPAAAGAAAGLAGSLGVENTGGDRTEPSSLTNQPACGERQTEPAAAASQQHHTDSNDHDASTESAAPQGSSSSLGTGQQGSSSNLGAGQQGSSSSLGAGQQGSSSSLAAARTLELEAQVLDLTSKLAEYQGYLAEAQEDIAHLQDELRRASDGAGACSPGASSSQQEKDEFMRVKVAEIQGVVQCIMQEKERLQAAHQQQLAQVTHQLRQATVRNAELEHKFLHSQQTIDGLVADRQRLLRQQYKPERAQQGEEPAARTLDSEGSHYRYKEPALADLPGSTTPPPQPNVRGCDVSPAVLQLTPNPLFEGGTPPDSPCAGGSALSAQPAKRLDGLISQPPREGDEPGVLAVPCLRLLQQQSHHQDGQAQARSQGAALPSSGPVASPPTASGNTLGDGDHDPFRQAAIGEVEHPAGVLAVRQVPATSVASQAAAPLSHADMSNEEVVAYSQVLKARILSEVATLSERLQSQLGPVMQQPADYGNDTATSHLQPSLPSGHLPQAAGQDAGMPAAPFPGHEEDDVATAFSRLKDKLRSLQMAPDASSVSPLMPAISTSAAVARHLGLAAASTLQQQPARVQTETFHTPGVLQFAGGHSPAFTPSDLGSTPGSAGHQARGSGAALPNHAVQLSDLPPSMQQYAPPSLRGVNSSLPRHTALHKLC